MRAHGPTGTVTIKSLLVAAALCLLLGRSLVLLLDTRLQTSWFTTQSRYAPRPGE